MGKSVESCLLASSNCFIIAAHDVGTARDVLQLLAPFKDTWCSIMIY